MKSSILSLSACAFGFGLCSATAATTLTFGKMVSTDIPDNNAFGLASVIAIAGSGQTVTSVEVLLQTRNGWNGDLYAFLEHNGVISVLLNRPGRTVSNPAGAASSGMQIRLVDSGPADIHTAISNSIGALATGIYQPDARATDPSVVTDSSPRSLHLSGFHGQEADGDWTLFVSDRATGDVASLDSWSLSLTVIPEPDTCVLIAFATLPLLLHRRRHCDNGGVATLYSLAATIQFE
jgi:hypothetical protein